MKREHYFKDDIIIICSLTGGEFSKVFLENNPTKICPCCLKPINMEKLKK